MTSSSLIELAMHRSPRTISRSTRTDKFPLVDGELIGSEAAAIMLHLVDQFADGGLSPQIGTLERVRDLPVADLPDELAAGGTDDLAVSGSSGRQGCFRGRRRQARRRGGRQPVSRRYRGSSQG